MRGTVLVVEDDWGLRESLRRLLEQEGYRVVAASGGREALDLLAELRPGMAVLDLMMPEVSGWDLIVAMQSDPRLSDVPVVIVSAMGKAIAPVDGVVGILQKPANSAELLALIEGHLPPAQCAG
jgi:DNA-binding response OmpR family regulator